MLDQVVKRFGSVVAVDRLTLEIRRGEFFSMLGPSGCGKTTTLRMIGGFETPTEGVVRLDGQDVTDLPAYKRNVNTVFQSYGLFPHLSVYDNVAFGLRRKHVPAVVGIDVVEVSPPYDSSEITAFLANRLVLEMLAGIAFRRKGGTWDSIPKSLLEGRA